MQRTPARPAYRTFSTTKLAMTLVILHAGNSAAANTFNIDVSDDDVAIEANNASLMELLQELEKVTGIPVDFVEPTDERVTLSVALTSVESAIGKITPNHMIVHENQDGEKIIKELIIIPADSELAGTGSGSAFLPNGNPAPSIEQATPQSNGVNEAVQSANGEEPDPQVSATPASNGPN